MGDFTFRKGLLKESDHESFMFTNQIFDNFVRQFGTTGYGYSNYLFVLKCCTLNTISY